MRREVPAAYECMCEALAPREVRLHVDGENVAVAFTDAGAAMLPSPSRPSVELQTTGAAILDLIGARETLASAVLADRLVLRGALGDVLAMHDGVVAYLHGAVRAPSFPALLRRYREAVQSAG